MKQPFYKSLGKNNKGFTLIEIIIVIGFFGFLSSLLMQNLFSIYQFKEVIRYKKDINYEASAVLNTGLAGLIRSGFAINYAETVIDKSDGTADTFLHEVDQLSIFTDRAETQYFTVYREPYVSSGDNADIARIVVAYSNGDTFPLHSSEVVIEDFDVFVPTDARVGGDRDIQPYVKIKIRARHRYPFGEVLSDESELDTYQTIRASYLTTYMLRNVIPSSYKTLTQ